jgi:isoleucyl-tRNA synthetase
MAVDFSAEEAATLKRWREIDAFQTQIELSRGNPAYTFFDGESASESL